MKKQSRSAAREAAFTQIFQINQHGEELDYILDELLAEKIPNAEIIWDILLLLWAESKRNVTSL